MGTKICTKCKIEYPATREYFYADKWHKGGLHCWCKECFRLKRKEYYQKHRDECVQQMKKYRQTEAGKRTDCRGYKKYHSTIKGYLRGILHGMEQRCNNPKICGYKNYGGRGIQNRFKSLDEFRNYIMVTLGYDTCEKIKGLQIDRINNNGHYEKGNIRFVTCKENNNNRRDNV